MKKEKKVKKVKKFESKYSVLKKEKLDDLYHINLLRELWSIPLKHIQKYIKQYYRNPTALEQVEINDLLRIAKIAHNRGELSEDDNKLIQYKHNRMYGRSRQIIEISGREGGPIEYSDLSDEELEKAFNSKLDSIKTALKKAKQSK